MMASYTDPVLKIVRNTDAFILSFIRLMQYVICINGIAPFTGSSLAIPISYFCNKIFCSSFLTKLPQQLSYQTLPLKFILLDSLVFILLLFSEYISFRLLVSNFLFPPVCFLILCSLLLMGTLYTGQARGKKKSLITIQDSSFNQALIFNLKGTE